MTRWLGLTLVFICFGTLAVEDRIQPETDIQAIEQQQGMFSIDLVEPLKRLAAQREAGDDLHGSLDAYHRAQHILHRAEGVHTLSQLPLLGQIILLAVRLGDIEQAGRMHGLLYDVHQKNYGETDPRTIDALASLAGWHQTFGHHDTTQALLKKGLATLNNEETGGKLRWQIERSLMYSDYLQGHCCRKKELQHALEDLLDDPVTDMAERIEGLLNAGDIMTMADSREARSTYRRHLQLMGDEQETAATPLGVARNDLMVRAYLDVMHKKRPANDIPRGELAGSPITFCASQLEGLREEAPVSSFAVTAELTISQRGKVKDLTIIESNAPKPVIRLFKKVTRLTRFRPMFEDGEPVESTIRVSQTFNDDVELVSDSLAFPPANIATFHGCHAVANIMDPLDGSPRIAIVQ